MQKAFRELTGPLSSLAGFDLCIGTTTAGYALLSNYFKKFSFCGHCSTTLVMCKVFPTFTTFSASSSVNCISFANFFGMPTARLPSVFNFKTFFNKSVHSLTPYMLLKYLIFSKRLNIIKLEYKKVFYLTKFVFGESKKMPFFSKAKMTTFLQIIK